MTARRPTPRSVAALLFVVGGALFTIARVMPWLAEHGYAGRVIQENIQNDRDATALFYTDHERTWAILHATAKGD